MDEDELWTREVRDEYARPVPGEPDARARLLSRVRHERAAGIASRVLRVSPLAAAAAIAIALGLGAAGGVAWMKSCTPDSGHASGPIVRTDPGRTTVTFVFRAPGASRVALVGDFNEWDPEATPLRRAALGDAWTADVALHDGLHVYAFVIDGREWSPDPSAPLAPESSYGRRNSVVVVGEGNAL